MPLLGCDVDVRGCCLPIMFQLLFAVDGDVGVGVSVDLSVLLFGLLCSAPIVL